MVLCAFLTLSSITLILGLNSVKSLRKIGKIKGDRGHIFRHYTIN
jgi:hypothetical protein